MGKLQQNKYVVYRLARAQEDNRALKKQLRRTLGRLEFLHGLTWERAACGYINNAHWITEARAVLADTEKVAS